MKKAILIFLFAGFQFYGQTEFVTTWKTDIQGGYGYSNETSITIPIRSGEVYNYDVSWHNDGNWETGFTGSATHDYGTPGTYSVAIRGVFPRIYFGYAGDQRKIQTIEQWGTNEWISMSGAFAGCANLVGNATDTPNLSKVTDMELMFGNAALFNQDIGNWDVSNVTNMAKMFRDAHAFNQDLASWDVSNVTDMNYMFYNARAFNGDVANWNVSNVTDMTYMFSGTYAFNGAIGSWDVGNVTDMSFMFSKARAFDGNIGTWNVGNVTKMVFMFEGAMAFNQDIGSWDVSKISGMGGMFNDTTLSTANYDALLNGWNSLTLKNGVRFSGGNSKYCSGAEARTNMIDTFGWIINDGGRAEGCELSIADADLNTKTIRLYPNPAMHRVVIENQGNTRLQELAVYDLIGRLVKTIDIQNVAQRTFIDVSSLEKATYFINITTDQGSIVRKFIKD